MCQGYLRALVFGFKNFHPQLDNLQLYFILTPSTRFPCTTNLVTRHTILASILSL